MARPHLRPLKCIRKGEAEVTLQLDAHHPWTQLWIPISLCSIRVMRRRAGFGDVQFEEVNMKYGSFYTLTEFLELHELLYIVIHFPVLLRLWFQGTSRHLACRDGTRKGRALHASRGKTERMESSLGRKAEFWATAVSLESVPGLAASSRVAGCLRCLSALQRPQGKAAKGGSDLHSVARSRSSRAKHKANLSSRPQLSLPWHYPTLSEGGKGLVTTSTFCSLNLSCKN